MPLPLMAIGMGLSVFGNIMGGLSAGKAYSQQAIASRIAAVRRRLKADDDARTVEDQGERFRANQAAGFAKSGVLIDEGSPLATLMDTAINVEKNAMKTRLSGSWDAEGLESQASAYDTMAKGARISGVMGAVGSVMSYGKMKAGEYKPPGSPTSGWITDN